MKRVFFPLWDCISSVFNLLSKTHSMVVSCFQKAILKRAVDFNVIRNQAFSYTIILGLLRQILNMGNFSDGCSTGWSPKREFPSWELFCAATLCVCVCMCVYIYIYTHIWAVPSVFEVMCLLVSQQYWHSALQKWLCCFWASVIFYAHILDVSRSLLPPQFGVNRSRASSGPCSCVVRMPSESTGKPLAA